jgi:hypothetical protein
VNGWPATVIGWPATVIGWPATVIGWPATVIGWPATVIGGCGWKLGVPGWNVVWEQSGAAALQGNVQEVVMVPHCVPPQSVRSATWFCLTPSTTVKHA